MLPLHASLLLFKAVALPVCNAFLAPLFQVIRFMAQLNVSSSGKSSLTSPGRINYFFLQTPIAGMLLF